MLQNCFSVYIGEWFKPYNSFYSILKIIKYLCSLQETDEDGTFEGEIEAVNFSEYVLFLQFNEQYYYEFKHLIKSIYWKFQIIQRDIYIFRTY